MVPTQGRLAAWLLAWGKTSRAAAGAATATAEQPGLQQRNGTTPLQPGGQCNPGTWEATLQVQHPVVHSNIVF